MTKKNNQDRINIELAKTYFSGLPQNNPPEKHNNVRLGRKNIYRVIPIFVALAVAISALIYIIPKFWRINLSLDISFKPPETISNNKLTAKKEIFFENGRILYNFEKNMDEWEIPAWEFEKNDHVAKKLQRVNNISSNGAGSLKLDVDFPGGMWTAALAEIQQYLDLTNYEQISVDIYLPTTAPEGLKAKIILTVGDKWQFTEMARTVRLEPGRWITITADLSDKSTDWKRTRVDKNFREDIRKLAVRIESNNKPAYSGAIYIDNIRVLKLPARP